MEERKVPTPQRGSIDGISLRRPNEGGQVIESPQASAGPEISKQAPPQELKVKKVEAADKKPKNSRNLPVIVPAVIIFVGLSAFAVYSGLQSSENGRQAGNAGSAQDISSQDNGQIIDQTVNAIDQLSDQPDGSGEELSDEQLGL